MNKSENDKSSTQLQTNIDSLLFAGNDSRDFATRKNQLGD